MCVAVNSHFETEMKYIDLTRLGKQLSPLCSQWSALIQSDGVVRRVIRSGVKRMADGVAWLLTFQGFPKALRDISDKWKMIVNGWGRYKRCRCNSRLSSTVKVEPKSKLRHKGRKNYMALYLEWDLLVFTRASTVTSGSPQILVSSSCQVKRSRTACGMTFRSPLRKASTCWDETYVELKQNACILAQLENTEVIYSL